MGSSNITCFASNQTISRGMACRVIPLLQNCSFNPATVRFDDESSQHYGVARGAAISAHDFWNPIAGFMEATYDDYGQVKLNLTDASRREVAYFLHELFRRTGHVEPGERSRESGFDLQELMKQKAPGFTALNADKPWYSEAEVPVAAHLDVELREVFEAVWDAAMAQRLFVKNSSQVVRLLQFTVMHESTYQALVSLASEGEDWEGVPMHAAGFVAHCVTKAREEAKDDPDDKGMAMYHALQRIRHRFDDEGLSGFRLGKPFSEAVRTFCKDEISDEAFVKEVAPLLEGLYANRGLNLMNLRFVPMSLCGQDYDNHLGKAYAKFIGKVSVEVTRANIEARFGELEMYSLALPAGLADSADGAALVLEKRMGDYDGRALIHSAVLKEGTVHVMLECTLDIDSLQDVLRDCEDTREFADSVIRLG
jgi:hypothetical protein